MSVTVGKRYRSNAFASSGGTAVLSFVYSANTSLAELLCVWCFRRAVTAEDIRL
jgi:hypothetical protein